MRPLRTPAILTTAVAAFVTAGQAACGGLVTPAADHDALDASLRAATDSAGFAAVDATPPGFDASGLASCVACLGVACEAQYVHCEQSASCYAGYQCARASGSGCDCSYEVALAPCIKEATCGACASLCEASDAGPIDAGLCGDSGASACGALVGASTATCDACVARSCGQFTAACAARTDCQSYVTCLAICTGSACLATCGAAHAAGQSAADALDVCLGGTCEDECG